MRSIFVFSLLFNFFFLPAVAQESDKEIHTKEGNVIGYKRSYVFNCKQYYGAPADNKVVEQVCECQVNLLDRRFTNKQLKSYEKKYKGMGLTKLIEEDTILQAQIKECSSGSSGVALLSTPEYKKSFLEKCARNLQWASNDKNFNDTLARLFCNCAADILESRKISLDKMDELSDASSFLYNEVAFKCGSPFLKPSDFAKNWKPSDSADIIGPSPIDSVQVISVMGMHKVKITIGKDTKIWLLDSGASELLISDEYLKKLKQQAVISETDFIGTGRYQVADGRVITCKRYKISNVKIGKFTVNNIVIASSKETQEFLMGKSLLNKFSQWMIDNKNNWLILKK